MFTKRLRFDLNFTIQLNFNQRPKKCPAVKNVSQLFNEIKVYLMVILLRIVAPARQRYLVPCSKSSWINVKGTNLLERFILSNWRWPRHKLSSKANLWNFSWTVKVERISSLFKNEKIFIKISSEKSSTIQSILLYSKLYKTFLHQRVQFWLLSFWYNCLFLSNKRFRSKFIFYLNIPFSRIFIFLFCSICLHFVSFKVAWFYLKCSVSNEIINLNFPLKSELSFNWKRLNHTPKSQQFYNFKRLCGSGENRFWRKHGKKRSTNESK